MTNTLTVHRLGDSLGVTLPEEVVDRFQLKEGDALLIVERADGVLLTPISAEDVETLERFNEIHREYRDAFRDLAKL